jgi:NIPSNAP
MIYEMRTYELKVGVLQTYLKLFELKGLLIVSRYCTLVGFWAAESGRLNRVVHIWSFADLEERRRARERWSQDEEWTSEYLPCALPLVESQESIILSAAAFSPIR